MHGWVNSLGSIHAYRFSRLSTIEVIIMIYVNKVMCVAALGVSDLYITYHNVLDKGILFNISMGYIYIYVCVCMCVYVCVCVM